MWPVAVFILWTWMPHAGCETQHEAEEVEIFNSDKQATLSWTSDPPSQWTEVSLRLGRESPVRVLQGCGKRITRAILSQWMERQEAHHLMMDVAFAQEEEPSGPLGPLRVHLFDTDAPVKRVWDNDPVLEVQASRPFPEDHLRKISGYLNSSTPLSLGPVSRRGFQLAFSYSGTCVFLTSIRLYYKTCPGTAAGLASFGRTGAGSGPQTGSCVKGAAEDSPPVRECGLSGAWGPLQGGCTCEPGHQVVDDTCQACRLGFYKPANESAGCLLCPANSKTHREGSERCDCLQGFSRLPTEPADANCTKPPSAPVKLAAHQHNDSVLTLTWRPPLDRGGRREVMYSVECERKAEAAGRWEPCEDRVAFLPDSPRLTSASVTVTGLNPQWDYRLSVQAWNDLSIQQGAQHASSATVNIHRWNVPPVVITASPGLNISEEKMTGALRDQRHFFMWLAIGVGFGSLLLTAVIPVAVCMLRRNYTKISSEQEIELLPVDVGIPYRHPRVVEAAAQQADAEEGVAQMLEGVSSSLLASLKEVLVERHKLTLGKELGKGEFGSVCEGVFTPEEDMDIKVAVKTMRVGIHSQEDLHEFLREAEIMKGFDHENVVRLLGVTLQREQDCPLPVPLVILPYMKHRDLRRFLIATRYGDIPMFVPHQSLLRFMIDIASAMSYLSSRGFLHRDLAARNCMLGDDLRVSVADFGMSRKIYSSNYYRQREVTRVPIKWMAMESLSESVYTTKTDVWSFGVTMWEIVSRGRTPYPGVHNHELLDYLRSGHRLKPPEECDQKLYEVMWSCWDMEPNRRPGFWELSETLKALLLELPALEASQEASYINQGLEAAAAAAAYLEGRTDSGGRLENVYLPTPTGASAAREEDDEDDGGYVTGITVSIGSPKE